MARSPTYSEAEDAILMATIHESADETNKKLREAGFPERTANSLKQRRYYLRNRGLTRSSAPNGEVDQVLINQLVKRRQLVSELARLRASAEKIQAEMDELNAQIHQTIQSLGVDEELVPAD